MMAGRASTRTMAARWIFHRRGDRRLEHYRHGRRGAAAWRWKAPSRARPIRSSARSPTDWPSSSWTRRSPGTSSFRTAIRWPTASGPSAYELAGTGRERYNDADDYHQFLAIPAEGLYGEALGTGNDQGSLRHANFRVPDGYFENWRQRVEVYFVDPDDHRDQAQRRHQLLPGDRSPHRYPGRRRHFSHARHAEANRRLRGAAGLIKARTWIPTCKRLIRNAS